MYKKILITGGAGFIGSHLIRFLTEQGGWDIAVLDALIEQVHPKGSWNKPDNVTFYHGDVCDSNIVNQALEGVEYVVHLAAETGVGQSAYEIARYVRTNELGTAVLLEQCAPIAAQIKSIVLASSRAVYGEGRYECAHCGPIFPKGRKLADLKSGNWDHFCSSCGSVLIEKPSIEDQPLAPASVYAITKHNQEQLVSLFSENHRVPSVLLRFQNVYGPGQSLTNPYTGILSLFSTRIRNGNPVFIYEDGLEQRDFVYVEDVARSICLALEHTQYFGEVFNVGSGNGTSVLDVAKILLACLDGESDLQITGQFRQGDIRHAIASLDRSRVGLGYSPIVSVEEGLKRLSDWVKEQPVYADRYADMEAEMQRKKIM